MAQRIKSGAPESRKAFWGEEDKWNEQAFTRMCGSERYEVLSDDVTSRELVRQVPTQNQLFC